MTKKKNTSKKGASTKRDRFSLSLRNLGLFIILAFTLTTAYFAYSLNSKIKQRLTIGRSTLPNGIYSDSFPLRSNALLTTEAVLHMLERRGYTPVISNSHIKPGEYFHSQDLIQFRTRNWIDHSFEERGGELATFNGQDGSISNSARPGHEFVLLGPELIAGSDTSDIRASRYKTLRDFPSYLINAVISVEDERFFSHFGIDLVGISRAIITNLAARRIVQGGSTITQQLAKNLFFSPTRSLSRKIGEALAALILELRLSKEEILELYLNEVYLGQVGPMAIHGMGEAAQNFFQKDVSDLTIAESAILAGLIKAPSYYAPRKHPARSTERMMIVLTKMHELNKITDREFVLAKSEQISVYEPLRKTHPAPYFVTALRSELGKAMNLEAAVANGASIFTGLNIDMQECGERALSQGIDGLKDHFRRMNKSKELQGGLISIDVASGKIRSWVGGADYTKNQFDHVYLAKRQVGSTIKPFVYLTALDPALNDYKVATPISLISDKPMSVDVTDQPTWEPENFSKQFNGDVTFRYAFENSLNIPAVYIGQRVGPEAMARTIEDFGVAKDVLAVPSLALGAIDTTLLNLATSYTALANGGVYSEPILFDSVRNNDRQFLSSVRNSRRVASEDAVYVVTDLMMGVIERGTGKPIRAAGFTAPAAGKTGTSNETRDAWFVGFTPDIVTGVWIGYDDNSETGLTGGISAAPIWAEYMKCIAPLHEKVEFIPPPGVVFVDVDYRTGSRALPGCKSDLIAKEVFLRGTEPISFCDGGAAQEQAPSYDERGDEIPVKRRRKSFWDILFG